VSSMHYNAAWHGGFQSADNAKLRPKDAPSRDSADQAIEPVVFTNVIHSPSRASARSPGKGAARIARLIPAELRRLFSFRDAEQEPSLLEFARRAKRSKS